MTADRETDVAGLRRLLARRVELRERWDRLSTQRQSLSDTATYLNLNATDIANRDLVALLDRVEAAEGERDHWKDHAEEAGRGFARVCRDYARVASRNAALVAAVEGLVDAGDVRTLDDFREPCVTIDDLTAILAATYPDAGTDEVTSTDQGRRLASERDDLIARGVDPADLLIPIHPEDHQ